MAKPRITYEITADDKSKKAVEGIEKNLKSAAKIGAAALATSAAAAGAALLTLGNRAADTADKISKLSTQLGISTKSLSEYQFVAEQTGVQFDTFALALQRSTRRIAEAAQGTGEAQGALKELGIDAERLNELDPGAQFELLAQQLSQVTNEADQVRLAFKLFDSEGVRLLRTVKETGGEFDVLNQRARELGAVIDDDLAQKGADVKDSFAEVGTALQGVGNTLLANFGPAIVSAANSLVDFINNARRAAADIGLLTLRVAELSQQELAAELQKNAAAIEQLATQKDSTDRYKARINLANQINTLEERNLEIKKQIEQLDVEQAERDKVKLLQKSAVTGDVGTSPEAAKRDEELQRYLESLYTEEEALIASYARRAQIIDENTTAGSDFNLLLKQKEYDRLEKAMLEHQARLGNIEAQAILQRRKFDEQNAAARTKTVLGEVASLTAGVAQENKALFNINKVAAIANAIISAHEGISKTLGAYPYPINIGMAALHAATAFAQVSAIQGTSFEGGGTGTTPSLAGTAPVINDIPVETAPVVDEGLTAAPASNVVNISFAPGITDTEAVRTFIEEDLAEALRDGAGLDVQVVAS